MKKTFLFLLATICIQFIACNHSSFDKNKRIKDSIDFIRKADSIQTFYSKVKYKIGIPIDSLKVYGKKYLDKSREYECGNIYYIAITKYNRLSKLIIKADFFDPNEFKKEVERIYLEFYYGYNVGITLTDFSNILKCQKIYFKSDNTIIKGNISVEKHKYIANFEIRSTVLK